MKRILITGGAGSFTLKLNALTLYRGGFVDSAIENFSYLCPEYI